MVLTRAKSYLLLAYQFNLHMLKRYVLRIRAGGLDEFNEYYRNDCLAPISEHARELHALLENCIACGECDPVCPVLVALGRDSFEGPEALAVNLSRNLPDVGLVPDAFRCTLCGACELVCPLNVPVPEIVRKIRGMAIKVSPHLLPKPVVDAAKNFKETGRPFPLASDEKLQLPREAESVYFMGCSELANGDHSGPELLSKLGFKFATYNELCCGGLPRDLDLDTPEPSPLQTLAEKLEEIKAKQVIASCSRCLIELRGSNELKDAGISVVSLVEVLKENIETRGLSPLPGGPLREPLKVAYHDSCKSGRLAGIYDEPRELLKKLGCEVLEFDMNRDQAPCCGGGGWVLEAEPDIAKNVARVRVDEAVSSLNADILVTSCNKCAKTFKAALKDDDRIEVATVASLAAKAVSSQ